MKKLAMLVSVIVISLGLSAPVAEAHTVYAGEKLFACFPGQYVAERNALLSGNGYAQAWTWPWRSGQYVLIGQGLQDPSACDAYAPAPEVKSATAIRHEIWVWPGFWYVCGFDYKSGFGSTSADASYIPSPLCVMEDVQHRAFVSHSVWYFGQEFIDAYILYH